MKGDEARRSSLSELSFVKSRDDGSIDSMWSVETTGVWAGDNAKGRQYAEELVSYMQRNKAPTALYHVAKAIPRSGECGIAVGFWAQIAARLCATEEN